MVWTVVKLTLLAKYLPHVSTNQIEVKKSESNSLNVYSNFNVLTAY